MEYTIDQLDNAILDIMSDYEDDALVDTITLYEKTKDMCHELKTMNYFQAEQKFMEHVININNVYTFIYPYVRYGRLFLIKSGPHNQSSWKKMYNGYVPSTHEMKSFDSLINYHNDHLLLQEKIRMKDNKIKFLEKELDNKEKTSSYNVSMKTAVYLTGFGWVLGLCTKYYLTGSFC